MPSRLAPFEETEDGLPAWRLQVDDPPGAAAAAHALAWRRLDYPQGSLLALALRVHEGAGRPLSFHHALLMSGPAYARLRAAGAMRLIFERHGFMSDARASLDIGLAPLAPALSGGPEALAKYVEAYRALLPSQGSPEAVWDAIERGLAAPVPPKKKAAGKLGLVLLALLAAALAAYFFFLRP
jgi:hypothetical protein